MLTKRRSLYFLLAIVLIGLGVTLLLRGCGPQRLDWRETYTANSKAPYGTFVLFESLKGFFQADSIRVLRDSLSGQLPSEKLGGTYLFVGEAMFLDLADQAQLLAFVEAGNTAFISSKSIPYSLAEGFYRPDCPDSSWEGYDSQTDSLAAFNFVHPQLRQDTGFAYDYLWQGHRDGYPWQFLPPIYFCEAEAQSAGFTVLGTMGDEAVNFARHPYGQGHFYLHTAPIAFSNLHLREDKGLAYLKRVLSHFDASGPVYWDAYSKVPDWGQSDIRSQAERQLSGEGPFQYILSQPPLAWAWYLLLAMGLLFLVFRAKREQRVIPVLPPNTNTSLEFLSAIGRLYFLQNNHRQLALLQMKLFLQEVRERYGMAAGAVDEAFMEQLAARSGVAESHLKKILTLYRNIERSSFMTSKTLADFHELIQYFHQNSK